MVIVRATHVDVIAGGVIFGFVGIKAIKAILQDGMDTPIGHGLDFDGPCAGGL